MNETEATVVKRGETCVQVSLRRGPRGLRVSAKAHPQIEELLQSWGTGEKELVSNYSRAWVVGEGEPKLQIWHLGQQLNDLKTEDGPYRIDYPGSPLILDGQPSGLRNTLNMSFLRLVGISEGAGRTFEIRGVYSLDYMKRLAERIESASRRFYIDFLLPIDLSVTVSTQETRL